MNVWKENKLREEIDNLKYQSNDRSKSRPKNTKSTKETAKRSLNEISKENESLLKRIDKLEQECNSLTYYRESMLTTGNSGFSIDNFDPEMRRANHESDTLRTKLEETTIYVNKFLLAMRRLHRGVKNKDPNHKNLKLEYERCKKELESW